MKTFKQLNIGDYIYEMRVDNNCEIIIEEKDITGKRLKDESSFDKHMFVYANDGIIHEFQSNHSYTNGADFFSAFISDSDMDKNYAIDGRYGFGHLIYAADINAIEDAKKILIANDIRRTEEMIQAKENELEQLKEKLDNLKSKNIC